MNDYIVNVYYWPIILNKEKIIRVKSDKTEEEICSIILKKEEQKNPNFQVEVYVQTLEEYLSDIETIEV